MGAGVHLSQGNGDVGKHYEVADRDGHHVRLALSLQLVHDWSLQIITQMRQMLPTNILFVPLDC